MKKEDSEPKKDKKIRIKVQRGVRDGRIKNREKER
jgi:hypothetical protein